MSILQEAHELIHGERQGDYGPPKENFQRIASIWSVVLGIEVSVDQVAACMVGLKLARLAHTADHSDSWKDIAGYVGCWERLSE
jgi:hypothetical protein